MPTTLFWVAVGVALVTVIILAVTLLSPSESHRAEQASADVSINAAEGSIVTVRKIGNTTRVVIRSDIHDHWEGADGVEIQPAPIEITKKEEPALFAEYMSPKTPAVRKYEIADYIYSIGLTLPFIHGLHEQWQKELGIPPVGSPAPVEPSQEHTPVNLSGGQTRDGVVYRKLDINHKLRSKPLEEIANEGEEETQAPEEEQTINDSDNENEN